MVNVMTFNATMLTFFENMDLDVDALPLFVHSFMWRLLLVQHVEPISLVLLKRMGKAKNNPF